MKILRVVKEDSCIGCRLCAVYASLANGNKVDLDSSFIKIVKDGKKFKILVDYGTKTDYDFIVKSCPKACFDILEVADNDEP